MMMAVAGRQRRNYRRAVGRRAGRINLRQLNNLMPIIGAFLDGAALPVAIEPLQVIVVALLAV